jgi:elongation factor G
VLCSVGGVQSQSITVDRQMRRYQVPRLCFINKCDRTGADPFRVLQQVRDKLKLNAAAVHYPIGLEDQHDGVVCLVTHKAVTFSGKSGEIITIGDVPEHLRDQVAKKRKELVEAVSEVDDTLGEFFLREEMPEVEDLRAAIRRATIARTFSPVFMGSAFKNRGVQLLLDGVVDYLPAPHEVENVALDLDNDEASVTLTADPKAPLVGLAFKLEEGAGLSQSPRSAFAIVHTRPAKGALRPEGRIPSAQYPDCLRNTNPSYTSRETDISFFTIRPVRAAHVLTDLPRHH